LTCVQESETISPTSVAAPVLASAASSDSIVRHRVLGIVTCIESVHNFVGYVLAPVPGGKVGHLPGEQDTLWITVGEVHRAQEGI
jgi:hypothetical protein